MRKKPFSVIKIFVFLQPKKKRKKERKGTKCVLYRYVHVYIIFPELEFIFQLTHIAHIICVWVHFLRAFGLFFFIVFIIITKG